MVSDRSCAVDRHEIIKFHLCAEGGICIDEQPLPRIYTVGNNRGGIDDGAETLEP